MRLVRWKAQIEGYSGIYTYADALREERHHCVTCFGLEGRSWYAIGMPGFELGRPKSGASKQSQARFVV